SKRDWSSDVCSSDLQVVGQVGDQGGACGRVVSQQVAVSHGDVRAEPAGELGGRALIDLDRLEGSAELGQGDGQRSVSWAPFDDRAAAAGGEFHDAGAGAAVAEEVLAQFRGSGMVTRDEGSWDGAESGSRTGRPAGAGSGARSSRGW